MSPAALTVLTSLVGVAALVAAVTALRHPVARRLALRAVRRRPTETKASPTDSHPPWRAGCPTCPTNTPPGNTCSPTRPP